MPGTLKEDDAEDVGLANCRRQFGKSLRRGRERQSEATTRNVTTKPMMNFGKRCQISIAFAVSPACTLIWLVQI